MSSSVSIKYSLTYFDLRALAECSRLLFVFSGTPFTDVRIPHQADHAANTAWQTVKKTTIFGKIPFLKVENSGNGELIAEIPQSRSIERYIAKKVKLYGDNDEEAALIDATIDQIQEIRSQAMNAKTEEEQTKFIDVELPGHLENFTRLLSRNKHGVIVGSRVSWADVALFTWIDNMNLAPLPLMKRIAAVIHKYDSVMAVFNKIAKDDKIAAHVAARKPTLY